MCGRFELHLQTLRDRIKNFNLDPDKFKSGEVFPTDNIVIIDKNGYDFIKWGIKPEWSKRNIINARIETINEKPFFKDDFANNRCVILATGYYEWTNKIKKELKIDDPILYFAGFYKIVDGVKEAVIITQEAQDEIRSIHDRMPVILNRNEVLDYLKDGNTLFTNTHYHHFTVSDA